jgi:hypothetical protein
VQSATAAEFIRDAKPIVPAAKATTATTKLSKNNLENFISTVSPKGQVAALRRSAGG